MWQSCGNISLNGYPRDGCYAFNWPKWMILVVDTFMDRKEGVQCLFLFWQSNSQMKLENPTEDMFCGPGLTNIIVVGTTSIAINWFVNWVYTGSTGVSSKDTVWLEVSKQTLHCCSIVPGSTHDLQVMNHVRFCIESLIPPSEESSLQLYTNI